MNDIFWKNWRVHGDVNLLSLRSQEGRSQAAAEYPLIRVRIGSELKSTKNEETGDTRLSASLLQAVRTVIRLPSSVDPCCQSSAPSLPRTA